MALGQENNAMWLSIANGKLVQSFKTPNDRTTERVYTVPKTGETKTAYEIYYPYVEGYITDIKTFENDYGVKWNVMIKDGDEEYIVSMPYSSRYSTILLKCLPNVDFSQKVKLSPKIGKDGNPTLFVNQGSVAIKHYYTKDDPKGLPPMVQQKGKGGKMEWSDVAMMEFLENMVKNDILPKIKSAKPAPAKAVTSEDAVEVESEVINDDDLPF